MQIRNFRTFLFFTLVIVCVINTAYTQTLRVGSFNLRYDNPADSLDNWEYRKDQIATLIAFHDFQVFGSQEGLKHQLEELSERLPEYNYVGVGRDDGKEAGEYAAIFFQVDKFTLLDQGNFWLSEEPSKPNKGWDAVLPRICTWAKFKHKETDFEFYFFNTHFDHVGTKARQESAKLILNKIDEIAGMSPVLLSGDFNVDQNSASYKLLNTSDNIKDSFDLAKIRYGAKGTTNGFDIDSGTNSRIDHIFVTSHFEVLKHGILTDSYKTDTEKLKEVAGSGNFPEEISFYANKSRYPSDHFPVLSILKIK